MSASETSQIGPFFFESSFCYAKHLDFALGRFWWRGRGPPSWKRREASKIKICSVLIHVLSVLKLDWHLRAWQIVLDSLKYRWLQYRITGADCNFSRPTGLAWVHQGQQACLSAAWTLNSAWGSGWHWHAGLGGCAKLAQYEWLIIMLRKFEVDYASAFLESQVQVTILPLPKCQNNFN